MDRNPNKIEISINSGFMCNLFSFDEVNEKRFKRSHNLLLISAGNMCLSVVVMTLKIKR